MRTKYLDELHPYQLKDELERLGIELTYDQRRILYNCGRTFLYASRDKKYSGSVIYRLTYPLYFLWNIIVTFIVQPTKWIFTGDFYFKTDNKIYKFTINWGRKIGF